MWTFGQRLYARRLQLGMTQATLARLTGLPQARVSEFERGVRTTMTLGTALRIARALGVGIDYLAGTFEDAADAATPATATPRRRGRPRKAAPAGATG
jgi:transcriptional regulator with XRE-family HTH domain